MTQFVSATDGSNFVDYSERFAGRSALTSMCLCLRDENSGEILWCPDCYESIMAEAEWADGGQNG